MRRYCMAALSREFATGLPSSMTFLPALSFTTVWKRAVRLKCFCGGNMMPSASAPLTVTPRYFSYLPYFFMQTVRT